MSRQRKTALTNQDPEIQAAVKEIIDRYGMILYGSEIAELIGWRNHTSLKRAWREGRVDLRANEHPKKGLESTAFDVADYVVRRHRTARVGAA